jgi:hypothetical protein
MLDIAILGLLLTLLAVAALVALHLRKIRFDDIVLLERDRLGRSDRDAGSRDPLVPHRLEAHRLRLLQALTTWIDHAERSTAHGGEIAVTAQIRMGDVVITIPTPDAASRPICCRACSTCSGATTLRTAAG